MLGLFTKSILQPLKLSLPKILFKFTAIQPTINNNLAQIAQCRFMANHRHKKMIKMAKGYRGRANRCYTVAKQRVEKALQYQYRDRKRKKRFFRQLWIQRINAASRIYGVTYGKLIYKLSRSNIQLNRKVLADLAVTEPLSFKSVIEVAKLVQGPINPKAEEHAAASAAAKAKKAKKLALRAKS